MKKIYILILILLPVLAFGQSKSFWTKTDASKAQQGKLLKRSSAPSKYEVYNLNLDALKLNLQNAESRASSTSSDVIIQFPNVNGDMENYQIYNASIMEEGLAENHPEIQSYVGVNLDSPGTTMRFSTTIFGFHAVVHTIGKTYYIDPYTEDLQTYVMYAKENLTALEERIGCLVQDNASELNRNDSSNPNSALRNANDGTLRSFRLALACTQEYANYHITAAGQQGATDAVKRAVVLAAMNVTMTRVNGIFERDLALTMTLVDNTSVIFLAENDGYTDNDAGQLINQNQTIIDTNIGTANYDIGHVFTTGGGGLASRGGICYSNAKARGVTGSPNPVGDPFDIDFVAHEMGHQYGANHTFNGGQGSCAGGNRNASTAVEPGSGTTIMAYAGICGSDNVQGNSDDHFHAVSIDEMWARITSSSQPTCSTNTSNGNIAPVVNAGQNYTIPNGTAFTLSGSATDANGDVLSYCWEQTDTGTTTNQPTTNSTTDPQFRSYSPMFTGDRTFPQLGDILDGNLTPQWEVIPSISRTMDFALTVRDNNSPNGGQTNRDDMQVTVASVGPFIVTAPNTTNQSYPKGSTNTISWDVAGTTGNGINTANVNILLSTDGGQNFDTVLASNTPNDGSQSITFPQVTEPYCRIKIEAVGNIFFAISKSFSVGATVTEETECNTYTTGAIATSIPDGSGSGNTPVAGTPAFASVNVTETTAITDIRVSIDVTHSYVGDLLIQMADPNGNQFINLWSGNCGSNDNIDVTFVDGAQSISCGTPTMGTYNPPFDPLSTFNSSNPSGDWNFAFVDFFTGDTGTVNEVSIELCTTTTTIELGTDEFELDNFALFPNPNNGDFTLTFNSNSGKDIDVSVYDISGKLINNKTYDPTAAFNENISLSNVSSGIYLMTVNDSDRSVTKKLIIN